MKQPIQGVRVLLVRDGKVAVSKRLKTRWMSGQWQYPGGTVEHPESPLSAARREVYEETGLSIDDISRFAFLGTQKFQTPNPHERFVFRVHLKPHEFLSVAEPDKAGPWTFKTPAQVRNLRMIHGSTRWLAHVH